MTLGLLPSVASAAVSNASLNNQKILQFMNAERAARGLSPLSRDSRLDSLAQSWANKMAANRTMYHPSQPQAMASAGYRSGAQNLAWHDATLTASWAHNFWMNSAPHRKNILDPAFTHTGIAIACNPSGGQYPYVFATVEFGGSSAPLTSTPPASPHVAGGESVAGAGCDGSRDAAPEPPPPAAPPPPAPPAPAAAPPGLAKASPKGSTSPVAPTGSKKASAAPSRKPSATEKPSATGKQAPPGKPLPVPGQSVAAALNTAAGTPTPVPMDSEGRPDRRQQPQLDRLATASADRTEENSTGALVALPAGVLGMFLLTRMRSRRRRVPPKHAITRR